MRLILVALLICASAQAENLQANINRIDQPLNQTVANAEDYDNTGTTISAKLCWDDATFAGSNCTTLSVNGGSGHSLSWTPATIGSVNPQDGSRHLLYLKALSPTAPGTSADRVFDGSPWPYIYLSSAVGPAWVANLESTPAALSKTKLAIFANSSDSYSVGSSGTTVCTVSGTAIKDDGAVGAYVSKYGISCSQVYVITTAVAQTITEANFTSQILPTLSSLPSTIQAIAVGWAIPVQVVSTSGGQYYPNTIDYVMSTGGVLYTGTNGVATSAGGNSCIVGIWHDAVSAYFNSTSKAPFTDFGIRPTMQLVGSSCPSCTATNSSTWGTDFASYQAALNTSYAANNTNPSTAIAYWARTSDNARSVMAQIVAPQSLGTNLSANITGTLLGSLASPTSKTISASNIMMYVQAADQFTQSGATFIPGSIAYSDTSFGGVYPNGKSQVLASWWLNQGAAASHGLFVEPCTCNILRMPLPEVMAPMYAQGQTAIEVMWKATQYPQDSVFVGDPLVHPFTVPVAPVAPSFYVVQDFAPAVKFVAAR